MSPLGLVPPGGINFSLKGFASGLGLLTPYVGLLSADCFCAYPPTLCFLTDRDASKHCNTQVFFGPF